MRRPIFKLMLLPAVALSGCVQTVTSPPSDCLSYIPDSWREPIPGAPLPDGVDARTWMQFGVEQSGQLEKANGRTADVLHVVRVCEANVNKARPRKKLFGLF